MTEPSQLIEGDEKLVALEKNIIKHIEQAINTLHEVPGFADEELARQASALTTALCELTGQICGLYASMGDNNVTELEKYILEEVRRSFYFRIKKEAQ